MVRQDKRAFSKLPSIARVEALASILSITPTELIELSESVDSLWKPGKMLTKKNGDPRPTSDAKKPLKLVHDRIKNRLLKQVKYPYYLLGGISDKMTPRDYKKHAAIHTNKKILISEDIKDFFPSTTPEVIKNIWQRFFNFHPEVACLLTKLTTHQDSLPQGWKASGYLANLALWDREPDLVTELERKGYAYSRFMDDITVSASFRISKTHQQQVIGGVYRMLQSKGYAPKRSKHKITSGKDRMEVTGLNVNSGKPTLPKQVRDNIRAQVKQCELYFRNDSTSHKYKKIWNKASGKVATLSRFHPKEGSLLRKRLKAVRSCAQ